MKKELLNSIKLIFPSKSENEALARHSVSAFLTRADPTIEELTDIRTAVSEAVTNCVVHAYRGTTGSISLYAKLFSDRTITITVKDRGCGIDDIALAMQPLYTTDRSGERGGMGFAIMLSFTDKLKVNSVPGRGTTVTMIKKLT